MMIQPSSTAETPHSTFRIVGLQLSRCHCRCLFLNSIQKLWTTPTVVFITTRLTTLVTNRLTLFHLCPYPCHCQGFASPLPSILTSFALELLGFKEAQQYNVGGQAVPFAASPLSEAEPSCVMKSVDDKTLLQYPCLKHDFNKKLLGAPGIATRSK